MMITDIASNRSFFIDHRIGTNTRGQVFESINGERCFLKAEHIQFVIDLFTRAADKLLSEPDERVFQIRKHYYAMQHEIIQEAIVRLEA